MYAITNEVLEPTAFVLACPTVLPSFVTAASDVALCCVLCSYLVLIAFNMHLRKHWHA